jgi:energy-coupling factor transport system permease protein
MSRPGRGPRLPRALHPGAWWLWAVGLVTAASRTTNPLLLLLIVAVAGFVVAMRRTDAPWARAFRYYLAFGLVVIALRVILRCIFGGDDAGGHVLARLPQVPLPHWATGVQIGGPITAEGTLAAAYDGLRLAALLCCVGAANALANPKRALRLLPGALYELGMAVVVAVSVAPQLIESTQRVVRARRLRGGAHRGIRLLHSVVIPVLHDALDRALLLAAAMDSRGYGRRAGSSPGTRRTTAVLLIAGLLGLCVGAYGLLGDSTAPGVALPGLLVGAALCVVGLALGGRRVQHTDYRPDPWAAPEWLVVASGVITAAVLIVASHLDVAHVTPAVSPLSYPPLPWLPVLAILVGAAPAVLAPPPQATRETRSAAGDSVSSGPSREHAGAAA